MKKLKPIISAMLFIVFSIIFNITAFAIVMPEPINYTKDKSLIIDFNVQESGVDVPIDGAEFGIVKIADFIDNKYIPIPELSDQINIDLNTMSKDESINLAKQLNITSQTTQITKINGKAIFNITDVGLYLISEVSANDTASEYQIIDPYIISVPYFNENKGWEYSVISKPKTDIIKLISSTPESKPESKPEFKPEFKPESKVESKPESKIESTPTTSTSNPITSLVQTGSVQYIINFIIILIISSLVILITKKRGDSE